MDTDQILDLFQISGDDGSGGDQKMSTKNVLESLEGLWDEKQYEEEYNLDSFISSLK